MVNLMTKIFLKITLKYMPSTKESPGKQTFELLKHQNATSSNVIKVKSILAKH